jgi:hypothetical protein
MVTYGKVWVTHHVGDDAFIIAWVLVEQEGQWRLDGVEVPSMDYPGMDEDPVSRTIRDQLGGGDFEHAMEVLARP